jgi:hypothetical protein
METGYLLDLNNRRIARNVINDLRCTYLGQEVFRIEPSSGLSANPYVEFFLRATQTGEITIDWVDDRGERGTQDRQQSARHGLSLLEPGRRCANCCTPTSPPASLWR